MDVGLICAHSPQAKGRVERLFGTLQDRLVKELSLLNISSIEEANKYLSEHTEEHNKRFACEALKPEDTHRSLGPHDDLDRTLCYKASRKLTKNLELSYDSRIFQIQIQDPSYSLRRARVEVIELLDGTIRIEY